MLDVFIKWSQFRKKPSFTVLSDMYGLGTTTSTALVTKIGGQNSIPLGMLSADMKDYISREVRSFDPTKHPTLNTLTEFQRSNISSLIDIKSYRGFRHLVHLPVRGQRTKTNARTRKNFKPRASLLRKSYRHKSSISLDKKRKSMYIGEVSEYTKASMHRSRTRKCFLM